MSWSDKEIDEIFREAFLGSKKEIPPYREEFFSEVENLLPKTTKKRIFWKVAAIFSTVIFNSLYFAISLKQIEKLETESDLYQKRLVSKGGIKNNIQIKSLSKDSLLVLNQINTLNKSKNNNPTIQNHGFQAKISNYSYISQKENKLDVIKEKQQGLEIDKSDVVKEDISQLLLNKLEMINPIKVKPNLIEKIENKEDYMLNHLIYRDLKNLELDIDIQKNIADFELRQINVKHLLYFDVSIGFSESFIFNQSSTKPMQIYAFGSGYKYQKNNYSFEIGLNLMNYKPSELNLNRQSKVYGFEVNRYSQVIDYKWISNIEIPIIISRRQNNHQFGIGFSTTWMLGSMIDFSKSKNGTEIVHEHLYFNKFGLNDIGLKPQINYSLCMKNNFELGLKISANLINPLDNSKFKGEINEFPLQAQFTIRKNISIK